MQYVTSTPFFVKQAIVAAAPKSISSGCAVIAKTLDPGFGNSSGVRRGEVIENNLDLSSVRSTFGFR